MKNFKLLTLFLFFTLVGLSSCGKDDDGNGEDNTGKVKLTAVFKHKVDGIVVPNLGTKMYIFKNTDDIDGSYDPNSHTFKVKNGTKLQPIYIFTVNNNGVIEEMIADNASYIYAYEPGDTPTKFGVDRFKTEGNPVTVLKVPF